MPAPFPHRHSATISRTFASRARVDAPPRSSLCGGPSTQNDGDVSAWSPEQLVLSSLGLCMLTTFEALAARDGIELLAWSASARGTVERTPEGLRFTSITLAIELECGRNAERVPATLEDAQRYCLLLNTLRVPVTVETALTTRAPAAVRRPRAA